jgi:Flp pilus assembly pilin Flp
MSQRKANLADILRKLHRDERGGVSIETILIIAAIAIPILIFLIRVGWPKVKDYFNRGMQDLEQGSDSART